MIINHLLKFTSLIVFIFHCASAKEYDGDCEEIYTILNSYENTLIECTNNDHGNVVSMNFEYNNKINTADIKKILNYNTLTKIDFLYSGSYNLETQDDLILILKLLSDLTNLEELNIIYEDANNGQQFYHNYLFTIDKNILKSYKNLKKLGLKFFEITQDNIDELSSLKNFKELYLNTCKTENLNFEYFDNLEILTVHDGIISYVKGETVSTEFDEKYIKQFKNLKKLTINDKDYNLTTATTIKTSTTKKSSATSTNGRCGKEYGYSSCPSGQCCSKYNHCGTSDDHCLVSKGCQSEFGKCTSSTTITTTTTKKSSATSTNGRCGRDYGYSSCPSGQCCSKYNHCGTSDDHCLASKGCQSEFGKCTSSTTTSTNGRCGKDYDYSSCPSSQCCSKYGYCGTSDEHCLASKGCQSEFGKCTSSTTTTTKKSSATSTNGRCGKDYGYSSCPSGQCCSKYSYCGTSDDYCLASKGCQSEFGKCK